MFIIIGMVLTGVNVTGTVKNGENEKKISVANASNKKKN